MNVASSAWECSPRSIRLQCTGLGKPRKGQNPKRSLEYAGNSVRYIWTRMGYHSSWVMIFLHYLRTIIVSLFSSLSDTKFLLAEKKGWISELLQFL